MRVSRSWLMGCTLAPWLAVPVFAQTPPEPAQTPAQETAASGEHDAEPEDSEAEIVVTGQRERGSVPGDIKPELQLRAADIRAYGVSSVSELLTELGPQVRSDAGRGGGQPVVMLNGRRISGFGEIRDLPTEAIERVDILPEEAALQLGYRPDQRVVNFVLRRRFRAWTGELQGGGATRGDRYTAQADVNRLSIARDRRFSINLHYEGATPIYESDRDITQSPPTRPYGIAGNLIPTDGSGEIDPLLSASAGRSIALAGVPEGLSGPLTYSALILDPAASSVAAYRTITAATRTYSTNVTYARNVFGNVGASINASLASTATDSALGLGSASYDVPAGNPFSPFSTAVTDLRYLGEAGARERGVDGLTGHVGATLNGDAGRWRWAVTGNFDRNFSRTLTDSSVDFTDLANRIAANDPTLNPFGRFDGLIGDYRQDYARSLTTSGDAQVTASGPLLALPAGNLVTSFKTGFDTNDFSARAIRSGIDTRSSLGRDIGSFQGSVDVPIASKRNGVLAAIGTLSINGNFAYQRLSDFGGLKTHGYGFTWQPITAVRLIGSVNDEQGPPTVAQLGNPVVVTPGSRIFDYVTGDTVEVTRTDGGNRALLSDDRRVTKLGLTLKPFTGHELTLSANYVNARTRDMIASFPTPTAAIEAAFPDRFTRDADGQLLRIDARPVNFARQDSEELRWGVNFSTRLGPKPPERPPGGFRRFVDGAPARPGGDSPPTAGDGAAQAGPPPGPPAAGGDGPRGGFGRGGFGPGGGFGGGRLQFAVYHTLHMRERVLIRPGVPGLDLLNGDAIGASGGQPRHEIELQAGGTLNGYGIRLSGNWESGTRVNGGTAATPTDLNFGSLATLNLRLFTNFQPNMQLVKNHRWLRGTRVVFAVQNLFGAQRRVTDATGAVPINYQPDILDPIGRTVRLSIRKLFF